MSICKRCSVDMFTSVDRMLDQYQQAVASIKTYEDFGDQGITRKLPNGIGNIEHKNRASKLHKQIDTELFDLKMSAYKDAELKGNGNLDPQLRKQFKMRSDLGLEIYGKYWDKYRRLSLLAKRHPDNIPYQLESIMRQNSINDPQYLKAGMDANIEWGPYKGVDHTILDIKDNVSAVDPHRIVTIKTQEWNSLSRNEIPHEVNRIRVDI